MHYPNVKDLKPGGGGGGGGGGYSEIFIDHFWGVKNFEFQYFGVFSEK